MSLNFFNLTLLNHLEITTKLHDQVSVIQSHVTHPSISVPFPPPIPVPSPHPLTPSLDCLYGRHFSPFGVWPGLFVATVVQKFKRLGFWVIIMMTVGKISLNAKGPKSSLQITSCRQLCDCAESLGSGCGDSPTSQVAPSHGCCSAASLGYI